MGQKQQKKKNRKFTEHRYFGYSKRKNHRDLIFSLNIFISNH